MSTEVDVYEDARIGDGFAVPGTDLIAWAHAAKQAHLIAQSLAETQFVPRQMHHRPDDVCAAILTGRELGLAPMQALQQINIIDGRPAISALGMRGLVQAHGHTVWVEESNQTRAIVCAQRRASIIGPPSKVERSAWDMDRARKAGLAGKKNWQNHPQAMLIARATAEVCRLVAADVLRGLPYAVEELADGAGADDVAPVVGEGKRPGARRVARVNTASTAGGPAPSADDAPPAESVPAPASADVAAASMVAAGDDGDRPGVTEAEVIGMLERSSIRAVPLISDAQTRRLHVAFRDAGIDDRTERLRIASLIIGHDVTSSRDLTMDEARQVIDALIDRTDKQPAADDVEAHIAWADTPDGAA